MDLHAVSADNTRQNSSSAAAVRDRPKKNKQREQRDTQPDPGALAGGADLELTTRCGYQQYIASKTLPAPGDIPVRKITVEVPDRFYAELRKRGGATGQPLAAMTVRQIHFIIRAAPNLAVRRK